MKRLGLFDTLGMWISTPLDGSNDGPTDLTIAGGK
jgi:hypothetical protein